MRFSKVLVETRKEYEYLINLPRKEEIKVSIVIVQNDDKFYFDVVFLGMGEFGLVSDYRDRYGVKCSSFKDGVHRSKAMINKHEGSIKKAVEISYKYKERKRLELICESCGQQKPKGE